VRLTEIRLAHRAAAASHDAGRRDGVVSNDGVPSGSQTEKEVLRPIATSAGATAGSRKAQAVDPSAR
jgi:hypothetical protein